uniref:Lipocalin/cytosolic fatty-acid binding domain-containing protein n=3 Tax=Neognathae TaxID=8825 RepID=G1N668_MELGA
MKQLFKTSTCAQYQLGTFQDAVKSQLCFIPYRQGVERTRMKYTQYIFLASILSTVEYSLAQTCAVDSFSVKDNFDPKRYAGKWYALAKKDPEGLFLQDNISAEYTVEEDGTMTASSKGRVKLFGFWVICADMAAQYTVPDPTTPAKMYMTYQGLASYLSSGGDNYWVIDTDYDNYAITYACRSLKEDGSCDDGYSLIFSRNPRGLPPAIQRIVRQKQEEICMSGQFQPVLQSGTSSQPAEKWLLRQLAGEVTVFAISVAEPQQAKLYRL